MSIKVEHLSYVYSPGTAYAYKALDDISVEIESGAFIGLIGATGSGKSTFVWHLNRLITPQSGSIVVDDLDYSDKSVKMKDIVRKVGIVFQYPETQLFAETVFDDIAFGPKNIGVSDEDLPARVKEAMEFVGLDYNAMKEQSPFDLSGGEQRRVAIAGVIAMQPEILVLDEPASGLDPMGRKSLFDKIAALQKETKMTVILVSHSMEDVANYCDKVMIMAKGKLLKYAAVGEAFSDPVFLKENGLDIPDAKEVLMMLEARGYPVDASLYKVDDAIAEIVRVFGGKTHA